MHLQRSIPKSSASMTIERQIAFQKIYGIHENFSPHKIWASQQVESRSKASMSNFIRSFCLSLTQLSTDASWKIIKFAIFFLLMTAIHSWEIASCELSFHIFLLYFFYQIKWRKTGDIKWIECKVALVLCVCFFVIQKKSQMIICLQKNPQQQQPAVFDVWRSCSVAIHFTHISVTTCLYLQNQVFFFF